jgi:hypothetical protein
MIFIFLMGLTSKHFITRSNPFLHRIDSVPRTKKVTGLPFILFIFFAYTYMCIYFIVPYSPSYPLSSTLLPSHWCQPSPLGRTCSALLFSDFVGEKREKIK